MWKGKNVTQVANKISAVYGNGVISERTVLYQIKTLVENNLRYTCELAEIYQNLLFTNIL